ncbi:Rieske (2Fe-2S) protein [Algoriphagus sp. C2-6-M1]|uniref:QcrA and Rieske domain-containing protein n=1 Tax=Algoriphagus persicinus TaxID=3108754 RepID=UPI002B3BC034|nr:Rieske (2Fe-2S) protein [Algoriphagus sp. C2-6-M1]MEB2781987.1 Rieske (2Fe-2S) protein [Algoriphagus sp. C2-6-M1]
MDQIKSKSGSLSNSRREFIESAGMTAVMTAFGLSFFTSCSDSEDQNPRTTTTPPPTSTSGISVAGNAIKIDLKEQAALATNGGWLLIINAQLLVVNVGGSYRALTSICTHSACDRNWTFTNSKFTCTCHGSEFDTSGNVLQGPAIRPLKTYATSLNGTDLTVTKS